MEQLTTLMQVNNFTGQPFSESLGKWLPERVFTQKRTKNHMLEEKLDLLTKEIVALRKSVEENTAAGGATSSGKAETEDKPAKRGRGRPAKEEVTPEHSKEEVEELVRRVSREVGKPAAVKIIKSFDCDDLADLLSHPEHYDAAFDKATEALPADEAEDGEDDI
jgi:hypothetical protein